MVLAAGTSVARGRRLLVITLLPWLFPIRLIRDLQACGFDVEVACPRHHPLTLLRRPPRLRIINPWRETAGLSQAVLEATPDAIIPCDEPAVVILHRIHRQTRLSALAARIEQALGDPAHFDVIERKSAVLERARDLGVRVPPGRVFRGARRSQSPPSDITYPCVLKCDGSWGGQGVYLADTQVKLQASWRSVLGWRRLAMEMRHAYHDRRPAQILRFCGTLEVQDYVPGAPANRAVLCHNGTVLAGRSVVALETAGPNEPATVVREIECPEMSKASSIMAAALGLSGFCGFDFILSDDGTAHLLELNARATPISHHVSTDGTHLPSVLFEHTTGVAPMQARARGAPGPVVLFGREARSLSRDEPGVYRDSLGDEPNVLF